MKVQNSWEKKILLIQLRTDVSEAHERECLIKNGGFTPEELEVVNVFKPGNNFPKPEDLGRYAGVITGASGQFDVTKLTPQQLEQVDLVKPLFRQLVSGGIPTLAICFGCQLAAKLFGGEVVADEARAEAGTYELTLTDEGKRDSLFRGLPERFDVVIGHKESVSRLPAEAVLLASSERCQVQAYRLGKSFYGVQFHPELATDDLVWRLMLYPEYVKGRSMEEVKAGLEEVKWAKKIWENYRQMVWEANRRGFFFTPMSAG